MKKVIYFKVRIEGIDLPSSIFVNRRCFERFSDAVEYLEKAWKEYTKHHFLTCCGRRVVNENVRSTNLNYLHQFVVVDDHSFLCLIKLLVDKCTLCIH